jgi:tetratricopeptide (TPR) repeat protein
MHNINITGKTIVFLVISLLISCGKTSKNQGKVNINKTAVTDTISLTQAQKEARAEYNNGNTYYYTANYTMAITSYSKAIELDSNLSDAYYHRGNVYYNTGELAKAIIDYNKTLELNPKNTDAMVDIYVTYKAQGNNTKADFWRKQALQYKDQLNRAQLDELGVSAPANRLPG